LKNHLGFAVVALILWLSLLAGCRSGGAAAYKDASRPIDRRVDDLLGRMTTREKVQQLRGVWQMEPQIFTNDQFDPQRAKTMLGDGIGAIGPMDDVAEAEVARRNAIQHYLVEQTRLGIPAMFHDEACHGYRTIGASSFPAPIGLACSWDEDLCTRVFSAVAMEMRARGVSHALTPIVDIVRDPRWGRTDETTGEDPYLNGKLGAAMVAGLQGTRNGTIAPDHIAATLKHYVGHGAPLGGVNRAANDIPPRDLYDAHLVPFRMALQAHPAAVMAAYPEIDGVPAHNNHWLLQDVLRREFGFDGLIVSDYDGIEYLNSPHHVAASMKEAALKAFNAGVELNLPKGVAYQQLTALVESGQISQRALDAAVRDVLRLKFMLGLFEHPYGDAARAVQLAELDSSKALALESARKSIVLLKNADNVLPLSTDKYKTIAVVGPNAASARLGSYSGDPLYKVSLLDGIRAKVGDRASVVYAEGVSIATNLPESSREAWDKGPQPTLPTTQEANDSIAAAVEAARNADVIVLALGENELYTREAWSTQHIGDRASLDLPGRQDELADAIFGLGKPVVVYLMNGRPLATPRVVEEASAVIEGWYMGQETGNAAADVLFGDVNPSGKLTITIPRASGQVPIYYDYKPGSRLYDYVDVSSKPLFPFGYGLSYTSFEYADPALSATTMQPNGSATVSVAVTNTGQRAGDEIVQFYIRQKTSSVTRPVKELKGFQRITLAPGEQKIVTFPVDRGTLEFHDIHMKRTVEPGDVDLMVGPNSDELKKVTLKVVSK
jgi:beta-glucosidase